MKAKYKKLLIATLATTAFYQPYTSGTVHAEDVSNNEVTVTENSITSNGETINYSVLLGNVLAGRTGDSYGYEFFTGRSAASGDVYGNIMTVRNANLNGYEFIVAGSTIGNVYNNVSYFYNVSNVAFIDGGFAYDGSGDVWNNTVNFYSGIVGELHGGHSNTGKAYNNTVNIYGGTVKEAGGGYSNFGDVTYNTLNMYGGEVTNTVYGGRASYGGSTSTGNAIGNTLNIYGGKISGEVHGGWAPNGNSIDNVLNVYGSPDLRNAVLYAGRASDTGESSGNKLNIHTSGITAQNISGFESLNFYIPADAVDGSKTLLTLTDSNGTDLTSTAVNVLAVGSTNITPNTTITLLTNNSTAGITTSNVTVGKTLSVGISEVYDLTIDTSNSNSVIATIGEGGVKGVLPPVEPPPPIIFNEVPDIPDNIDLDTDSGDISYVPEVDSPGWEIFGDLGGGSMRHKIVNGYIDTKTQNIDMGFARSLAHTMANHMTFAPVIDYQNTNFDTYSNGVHSSGKTKYTAGGFVLRNMNRSGLYYEGSLRAGEIRTHFSSNDLDPTRAFGTITYNTSAPIFSGTLKVGKYLRMDRNNLLNVYGNYAHSYQGSSNADLSSGDHYSFSSANAGKLRLGYRLTTRVSRISQIYTGLAYQFEHSEGITATYKGHSSSSGSHNGSSGMLELGWVVKPLQGNPWVIHMNATGWLGDQRGIKAFAKVQKSF